MVDKEQMNEMRHYMNTIQGDSALYRPKRNLNEKIERKINRIVMISENLYNHLYRLNAEDFTSALNSEMAGIQASNALDQLMYAIRQGEKTTIVESVKYLLSFIGDFDEDDVGALFEIENGNEIDIYSSIQSLNYLFEELNSKKEVLEESIKVNYFTDLVKELDKLAIEWSKDQFNEDQKMPKDYADDVIKLLENKFGIILER